MESEKLRIHHCLEGFYIFLNCDPDFSRVLTCYKSRLYCHISSGSCDQDRCSSSSLLYTAMEHLRFHHCDTVYYR